MAQLPSRADEEVGHALAVIAAADKTVLRKQIHAQKALGKPFLLSLEIDEDNVAVEELEDALSDLRSTVDPEVARAAQATENVWREIADNFGLLKSSEVSALLGASKSNREFVSTRRARGELLGVVRNNGYLYPGFQFDRTAGTIKAWVKPLLQLAEKHSMGAADVLFWMMSPTTYFDGARPTDHVDDADRLLDVASRAWDVEW